MTDQNRALSSGSKPDPAEGQSAPYEAMTIDSFANTEPPEIVSFANTDPPD